MITTHEHPDNPGFACTEPDTAEAQAEADRAVILEAEATSRRYGGACAVCGVLRDYHPLDYETSLIRRHIFTR